MKGNQFALGRSSSFYASFPASSMKGMDMAVATSPVAEETEIQDWKVGVDIGGTFIDFCALETRSGRVASLKVLTTPDDPGAELMTGLTLLAEREGLDPASVSRFVHGTTVGINTVIVLIFLGI